ncbi:patatin-like protein 1 [Bidens hawaiensis]|uniref:patatin-like protein 1 n=1 Tax=Bidens hawaiensis TaxID=980011 RepID=UPI00404A1473
MDYATKANLRDLEKVGHTLLRKRVTRMNTDTGEVEPVEGGVLNNEALTEFAKQLVAERELRNKIYNAAISVKKI